MFDQHFLIPLSPDICIDCVFCQPYSFSMKVKVNQIEGNRVCRLNDNTYCSSSCNFYNWFVYAINSGSCCDYNWRFDSWLCHIWRKLEKKLQTLSCGLPYCDDFSHYFSAMSNLFCSVFTEEGLESHLYVNQAVGMRIKLFHVMVKIPRYKFVLSSSCQFF